MNDKSSTSLALISVLSILIVLFIAISNVEDAPVRRPFPTVGADNNSLKRQTQTQTSPAFINTSESIVDEEFANKFPEFVNSLESNTDGQTASTTEIARNDDTFRQLAMSDEDSPNWQDSLTAADSLVSGINSPELTKAGFQNFIIKPKPFSGVMFDVFEVPMLTYLNVVEKQVIRISGGNEEEILRIYQFSFEDSDGAKEIYDFLKADLKGSLGVSINETNQFGMSSFYINFQTPKDLAFLVVKTKTNVYALSYPKSNEGEETYFELVSRLLSEIV